jgi:DNA-directed RNA polymerase specialized sigma24 family protein
LNQEHLLIIQSVAARLAPKYTFGYLDNEDLIQEAIIMGLEGYPRWDQTRPLENFISSHISNRLKNYRRDNYYRCNLQGSSKSRQANNLTKRKLMEPVEIMPHFSFCQFDEAIDNLDEIEFVMSQLPQLLRNDLKRLLNGASLQQSRKQAVYDAVKEILNEDEDR